MSDDELKQELIRQMGSRNNKTALAAVQMLRDKGWLQDDSLAGATLWGADLRGAYLIDAQLSRTNLTKVYLTGAYLINAKLIGAQLSGADLSKVYLSGANLTDANLDEADLTRANLDEADLTRANLQKANLRKAHMTAINLTGADLRRVDLTGANLRNADLTHSLCSNTIFVAIDLSTAKGLESIDHKGRSVIDFDTLRLAARSGGSIPEVFLRGCGLSDDDIQYAVGLYGKPIDLYSAFISYSHDDQPFATQLYNTLQGSGVRCWQDVHELDPGQKIHHEVAQSIRIYDKILLICSQSSLNSRWVNREIEMALLNEEELSSGHVDGVIALIPVDIDGYLFDEAYTGPYKAELTSRLAARFTGWATDHTLFEDQFNLLMRSLDPSRENRPHPEPKLKKEPE
jgi:hypothetical protein